MPDNALEAAAQVARASGVDRFDLAVVLGSGWGGAAGLIGEVVAEVPASQLAGFQPTQVAGHQGVISAIVTPTANHVLLLGARQHYYEGRDAEAVAHPVRLAAALGAKHLVLTNGCGALRQALAPGTVALISDHLNLTAATPLVGASFVDMTQAYSPRLRQAVRAAHPDLPEAVYAQFPGPQYETPAEVKMAALLGADLVGMSTALETIAAREAGLEVLGLSLVTNYAAGIAGKSLDHAEVLAQGKQSGPRLAALLAQVVHLVLAMPLPASEPATIKP
ncbi:MAG: purine-nucleoside phosphorylase [Micrococcales bacterium]|nr:purine-nucleoside phosphorylase [Micrococcales bacterium]